MQQCPQFLPTVFVSLDPTSRGQERRGRFKKPLYLDIGPLNSAFLLLCSQSFRHPGFELHTLPYSNHGITRPEPNHRSALVSFLPGHFLNTLVLLHCTLDNAVLISTESSNWFPISNSQPPNSVYRETVLVIIVRTAITHQSS